MCILLPEITLGLGILAIIIVFSIWKKGQNYVTLSALAVLIATLIACNLGAKPSEKLALWQGLFIHDSLAYYTKSILTLGALSILSSSYFEQKDFTFPMLEFNALVLLSILGGFVTVSAGHMITVFLGLELMYLPLYALVAMRKKHLQAQEAAIKYLIMGALASAFLLYGASLLYGVTGTMVLDNMETSLFNLMSVDVEWVEKLPLIDNYVIALVGTVMILGAMLFKFGSMPFHIWVPDVYQGATHIAVAIIGALPKLVLVILWTRLFGYQGALAPMSEVWQLPVYVFGVGSIIYGNLLGLVQTKIKRLLAYSSISHMGYILLALGMGSHIGIQSSLYYVCGYILVTITLFVTLAQLRKSGEEIVNIEDLKGLYSLHSGYAVVITVSLFSLIGIPPIIGFLMKMQLIMSLIEQNLQGIAIMAVFGSVLGAYYYLNIIQLMLFHQPEENANVLHAHSSWGVSGLLGFTTICLIGLSLKPQVLFELIQLMA